MAPDRRRGRRPGVLDIEQRRSRVRGVQEVGHFLRCHSSASGPNWYDRQSSLESYVVDPILQDDVHQRLDEGVERLVATISVNLTASPSLRRIVVILGPSRVASLCNEE
jgi:hypothetical protein